MDKAPRKFFSSKVSIVGLFATLTIILTIPLAVLLSQQQQSTQSKAAEPTVSPNPFPPAMSGNGSIAGYVYFDQNQNGDRDLGEAPVPNASIKITQVNDNGNLGSQTQGSRITSTVQTDKYGYFKYQFANVLPDSVNFIVKLELPAGYKTIDTNPAVFSNLHHDAKEVVSFGIFPLPSLSVSTLPTPICLGPNCPSPTPQNGCFYQKRTCTLACPTTNPYCCPPVLVCPTATPKPTCIPRPACLDAVPRCPITEPASGWCPVTKITPTGIYQPAQNQ